jgi:hypothetical protein
MASNARSAHAKFEFVVAISALTTLARWILSTAIHGTNYYGLERKMVQATVHALLNSAALSKSTTIMRLSQASVRKC